jgi:hypothetical protein
MRRRATTRRTRRGSAGAAWIPVALCLGLCALPSAARRAVRDRLLDLHRAVARLAREPGEATPVAADTAAENRARILEAELARALRALVESRGAQELVAGDASARLIPAEAMPLGTGAGDLLHRVALGRGRQDGVLEGLAVLAGHALVGTVFAATETTCEVRLVSDPGFHIRATLARAGGDVEGMLTGDGGDLLTFRPALLDIRQPAPVPQVGETILSSRASLLCGVPAVLGVVVAVERAPGSGLPEAKVRSTVDLTRLDRVVIVQ